jgi:hypothetical protein
MVLFTAYAIALARIKPKLGKGGGLFKAIVIGL